MRPVSALPRRSSKLFGLPSINFLGSTDTSLVSMMVVAVWKEAGLFMIFYLAALQSVPTNLKDAARLEGAGSVRVFFDVVLPLLRPTTIFVAVNALINAFRLVDHVIVMTEGGPNNSSALLLYYIYEVTFGQRDFAYGATLTVLMVCPARDPGGLPVLGPEPKGALPMNRGLNRMLLSHLGHRCWPRSGALPFIYSVWTAFHAEKYSANFQLERAADVRELRRGLAGRAVRALFPEHA